MLWITSKKSLRLLNRWTKDKNVHVRRLVSEGTRPRLPLASPIKMFIKDPRPIIPLLDKLKDDSDLYVRRSVANNLNDISKDNPEIVVETLRKWRNNASKERLWVIRHSLRTLYKRGNKDALKLMGFFKPEVSDIVLSLSENSIKIGKYLELTATISSLKDQNLMIDYVIHYMKANGKNSPKVFKISVKKAKKGQNLIMNKKIPFRQMTTRKHYKGKHFIELIINGYKFQKEEFMLK